MNDEATIFNEALAKESPQERSAYLDKACGGSAELRAQVEVLLAAHDRAGSFLESPPAGITQPAVDGGVCQPPAEGPGAMVGSYKLLEQIGEGGMGVVFMAEQVHPVRRRVALKIIKPGMDTRKVIARFEAERQALAMMDHPNIAKVLEAGATAAGRPYFVMELVKGIPITEYCDQQKLSPRERLGLFVQVCQAVQHAHQKGIIHRDLKPNNVLVTLQDGHPAPRVIDFGIAKATAGERLTDQTLFTEFRQLVGTPLYMSPEQAEMSELMDMDTRSDVYSLGVLLYELLTGTTPFEKQRLAKAAYDEVRRIIREEEPPRPSTRISTLGETLTSVSAQRQTDPKKLSGLLRGELDWIVMRALEKDRTRRYDTASGLAQDVERYLSDQPVEACPPSRLYRVRKFVRRNKAAITTAAVLCLVLLLATGVSSWQAVRATRARNAEAQATAGEAAQRKQAERATANEAAQRQQAEATAQLLESIFERLDPLDEQNPTDDLPAQLRARLDEMAADLDQNYAGDPLVRARLRNTLGVVRLHLGDTDKAMALFELAVEGQRAHAAPDDLRTLGMLYNLACMYRVAGRTGDAIQLLEQVKKAQVQKLGLGHQDTLFTIIELAKAYEGAKRKDTAIKILEEVTGRTDNAIKLLEEVQDRGIRWRGHDQRQVKRIMKLLDSGGPRSAELRANSLQQRLETLQNSSPATMWPPLLAERALLNVRLGHLGDAADDFARAQQLDPEEHWVWFRRGCLLAYLGDAAAYRAQCELMLARFEHTQDPDVADRLIKTVLLWQDGPAGQQPPGELLERLRPAVDLLKSNAVIPWREQVIGLFEYRSSHFEEAVESFWTSLSSLDGSGSATSALYLALAYRELGNHAEAAAALQFALQIIRQSLPAEGEDLGPDPQDWFVCNVALREAQQTFMPAISGRQAAPDEWTALIEKERRTPDVQLRNGNVPAAVRSRADVYKRLGRFADALADIARAVESDPSNRQAWEDAANLQLYLGHEPEYLAARRVLISRFADTKGDHPAKTCLLRPLAGDEATAVMAMMDRALSSGADAFTLQYFDSAKGMAEYRSRNYAEAVKWLTLSRDALTVTIDARNGERESFIWDEVRTTDDFFLAMCEYCLGDEQQARKTLALAQGQLLTHVPLASSGNVK